MEAPILGLLEPEGEVSGNCMQAACLPPVKRSIKIKEMTVSPLCQTGFNPNWHEGVILLSPFPFWITFCQHNFYQKFPNLFGGEN